MSLETAAESTARLGEAGEKPGPALISRVSCFTHRGGKLGKTVIMLQQTTTGLPLDESGGRDQLGAAAVCRATNGRAPNIWLQFLVVIPDCRAWDTASRGPAQAGHFGE